MSDNMPPSTDTPITSEQIDRLYERFVAGLKSGIAKYVHESEGTALVDEFVALVGRRVEARMHVANMRIELDVLSRRPFDPVQFLGNNWRIVDRIGKRGGDSLRASDIVSKVYLHEGETSINGGELPNRIKANPDDVQLDAEDFLALWQENGHKMLNTLYETKGITWLSFWGTILKSMGRRYVLYLGRHDYGSWFWSFAFIDADDWDADHPAGVYKRSSLG
ncbi:MAG: hypothetical protein WCV85_00475 [Patescibacteria group bacterium]|jgi:hypothetical protein